MSEPNDFGSLTLADVKRAILSMDEGSLSEPIRLSIQMEGERAIKFLCLRDLLVRPAGPELGLGDNAPGTLHVVCFEPIFQMHVPG
jgi:hypothetical protein